MNKKDRHSRPFAPIGFFVIITMALQIIPKLPYPEDTLGWILTAIGYSIIVGLICAGLWYASIKSK